MTKYISMPQEIDAVRWNGDINALFTFVGELHPELSGIGYMTIGGSTIADLALGKEMGMRLVGKDLQLMTIDDQWVPCLWGHYVIAEPVPNRYYPCAPEVLTAKYCEVD